MNKELLEMLENINNKKKEARSLLAENKIEEAKALRDEIKGLQDKFDIAKDLYEQERQDAETGEPKSGNKVVYNGELFTRAVANSILEQRKMPIANPLTREQQDAITEHIGEDGGYAVPEDIQVKINKRLKDMTDVSTLVDSEKVYTRKGQRTYEKRADQTALANLDEGETIPGTDNAKLERISFNLHDFAGMITIPNDLLQFGTKDLETFLIDWLVDKVRVTRNTKLLYGTGGGTDVQGMLTSTAYTKAALPASAGIKDFKKLKNVTLMNVFKINAKWIVNQDGFNYLDSLEDKQGRPYLQPNPKDATQYIFLGLPVVEMPNTILKTTETDIPIIFGDLKEAHKYFYDDDYKLLTTNIGAGAFETNTTKTRVITKIDGTVKDKDAIIIVNLPKPAEA